MKLRPSYLPHIPVNLENFVGRDEALELAIQDLSTQNRLAVVGEAGIGKTAFAAKLAYHLYPSADPSPIFYHSFELTRLDKTTPLSELAKFLEAHGEDEASEWVHSNPNPSILECLDYFGPKLKDQDYLLIFDNLELLRKLEPQQESIKVLEEFHNQLGRTRLLFIGRENIVEALNPVTLLELPLVDFITLLKMYLPKSFSEETSLELAGKLYNTLRGNPQYLRLFAYSRADTELSQIELALKEAPLSGSLENWLHNGVRARMTRDEQIVLEAITAFHYGYPKIDWLVSVLADSRLLSCGRSKAAIEQVTRHLGDSPTALLVITSDGCVNLHPLNREFWNKELQRDGDIAQVLHRAVVKVDEIDRKQGNSRLNSLEVAFHYFEIDKPLMSFKILDHDYEKLVEQGNAQDLLKLLKRFRENMFAGNSVSLTQYFRILGDLQRLLGYYEDSIGSHRTALQKIEDTNGIQRATLLIELGIDYIYWKKQIDESEKLLEQACQLLIGTSEDLLLGKVYLRLAQIYGQPSYRNYQKMRTYAVQSVRYLELTEDFRQLIRAYDMLAEAYFYLGDRILAIDHLDKAYNITVEQRLVSSYERMLVLGNRGLYHLRSGNLTEAEEDLLSAIKLNSVIGDLDKKIAYYLNYGEVLAQSGRLEKSRQYIQEAINISKNIKSQFDFSSLYNGVILSLFEGKWQETEAKLWNMIGVAKSVSERVMWHIPWLHLRRDQGLWAENNGQDPRDIWQWQDGLEHYNEVIKIKEKVGQKKEEQIQADLLIEAQGVWGEIHAAQGEDLEEVLNVLQFETLPQAEKEDPMLHGMVLLGVSATQIALKHFEEANRNLNKAIQLFRREDFETARAWYYRGKCYQAQGKMEQAWQAWQESLKLFKKINSHDYIELLNAILQSTYTIAHEAVNEAGYIRGLSAPLSSRLHTALQKIDIFQNDDTLQSIFVDKRINHWYGDFPEAKSDKSRVRQAIAYLYDKYNITQENALVLLLRVISEHIAPDDARYQELTTLANELEESLRASNE